MKVLGLFILIIKLSNALMKQPRHKWMIKSNNIITIQQQYILQAKSRSHDSYPHNNNNNHHHSQHYNNDEDYDGDDDNLHIERWEKSKSPSLEELFERDGVMYLCAQSPHSQEDEDINTFDCIENNLFSSPKFESDMFFNDEEEDYNNNINTTNNNNNTKKNKKKIITLPIMPFESPLFLGSKEFLYIYEMRFRTMMNNVEFQHDNFMGRCYLSENGEVGLVGSLCKIVEKKKMEDGKGFFIIEAVQRFKIRKVIQSEPFLTAEVELHYEDEDENGSNEDDDASTTTNMNVAGKNNARNTKAKTSPLNNNSNNNNNNNNDDDITLCENLCHDVYTLLKIYLRIHKIQKYMSSNINISMGVGVGCTVSSGTVSSSSSSNKNKSSSSSTAVSATASDSNNNNNNNHPINDKFSSSSSTSSSSSSSTDTSNISFQPAVHNNRPRSGLTEVDLGRSRHQTFSHACANILSTEPSILQQIFQSTSISYRLHGVKRILTEAVDELSTLMIEDGILTRELLMSIVNMSTNIHDDDSDLLPPNGQPQDVSLEREVDSRFHHFPGSSTSSSSSGTSSSASSSFSSSSSSSNRGRNNSNNYKTTSWNDYISSDGYDCSSDEGTEDDYYNYGSYSRNDGSGNSHYGSSYDYREENGSNSYYDIHINYSRHHNYDNINTDSSDINNKQNSNSNKKKQELHLNESKKEGLKREIAAYKKQQQSQLRSQSQQQSQSQSKQQSQRITPITAAATTTATSTTTTASTQTQKKSSNTNINKSNVTNNTDKEWAADEGNSFQ